MNIFADERNLVHDQSQDQLVGFVNIRKELYGWKKDPDLAALSPILYQTDDKRPRADAHVLKNILMHNAAGTVRKAVAAGQSLLSDGNLSPKKLLEN